MIRFVLLALLLAAPCVAASPARADAPPGNVYQSVPFSANPSLFTSVPCGPKMQCSASDSDLLRAANQCANQRFGFPDGIMGSFIHSNGPYKNCAIPTTFAKMGSGLGAKAQWPICCLSPDEGSGCQMVCHYYLTNEYNG